MSVQISLSLRRHYPDQVPGVEALRLLSANSVRLPQRSISQLLSLNSFDVKRRSILMNYTCWSNGMSEYWSDRAWFLVAGRLHNS